MTQSLQKRREGRAKLGKVVKRPARSAMLCGHCRRLFGLLHFGNGPGLCCECVRVKRQWLTLGGNRYAKDDQEHDGGKWCASALRPLIEFAEDYAARSGVTVEWLRENGREPQGCDCSEPECEGFQMAHTKEDPGFGPYIPPYPRLSATAAQQP